MIGGGFGICKEPSERFDSACGSGIEFRFASLARKSDGRVLARLGVPEASLELLGVVTVGAVCFSIDDKGSVKTGGGRLRDVAGVVPRELRLSFNFSGRTSNRPVKLPVHLSAAILLFARAANVSLPSTASLRMS